MNDWYSLICKAFIYTGLIAFLIGFFTTSKTSLGAYIAGYLVFTLGMLMIMVIMFTNILNQNQNSSMFQIIYAILSTSGPFLIILGTISFILYLFIKYKNNIINGHVSQNFNSISNVISILLVIQFYLLSSNDTIKIPKITYSTIFLLSTVTAICSIILYIILAFYSTDGFALINSDKLIS